MGGGGRGGMKKAVHQWIKGDVKKLGNLTNRKPSKLGEDRKETMKTGEKTRETKGIRTRKLENRDSKKGNTGN